MCKPTVKTQSCYIDYIFWKLLSVIHVSLRNFPLWHSYFFFFPFVATIHYFLWANTLNFDNYQKFMVEKYLKHEKLCHSGIYWLSNEACKRMGSQYS